MARSSDARASGPSDGAARHSARDDEGQLLWLVAELAAELRGSAPPAVHLGSRLDTEIGLDSLALVELRVRVEQTFGVTLPDRVLMTAVTPAEWLEAVREVGEQADWRSTRRAARIRVPPPDRGGESPAEATTLLEALEWHEREHPERVHLRLLYGRDEQSEPEELSYGSLAADARAVAGGLAERGIGPGDAVAIMLPTGRDYFSVFIGILMAGGVAVPIYPPARPSGLEEHLMRQVHILGSCRARVLVSDPMVRVTSRLLSARCPSLEAVLTADALRGSTSISPRRAAGAEEIAMLQYTSGSTGHPKGVVLAHRHLVANIRAMGVAADATPADVFVSWLPLYHDMGLIAAWLGSLLLGFELELMSPLAFVSRPERWLRAIDAYRGTLTAAPNFGYELALRHLADADVAKLDLTSWRLAFNGAEPVSPSTIARFAERLAPAGFRAEVMTPVYGLAEAGVALTFPPLGRGPLVDVIERDTFARTGHAVPARSGDTRTRRFVCCGRPLPGYRVRVLDATGHESPDRREGRIQFAGPSATPGYFSDEKATAALRHDGWLDTGDLGYLAGDELYVTGRSKDIVIKAGRNLHPEELEEAVGGLPGVRKGCVAVFASNDPVLGTERLVVLAETRLEVPKELAVLRERITATTVDLLGTPPDQILLAPPGTVPKTSSGKIRRAASRERYERGELMVRTRGIPWQLIHVALRGTAPGVRRLADACTSRLYAAYVWGLLIIVGVPTWLAVLALPNLRLRWRLVRSVGRLLSRAAGIRVSVSGSLPDSGPLVIVANHGSFVDGLLLMFCLPDPAVFVAGGVFTTQKVAGPFLRKLGCVFTERDDPRAMSEQAHALGDLLRHGVTLVFFPEGGLEREAGLGPFHLGAFVAAGEAGAPVVPVGIRHSRDVLRPGGSFPRRGRVTISIGAPVPPAGTSWAAVLTTRDAAYCAVAQLSGEQRRVGHMTVT
jgi:1-acyl-sn-glycerol-3-phosphate acyltransferase